jgi:hypothetical protein
MITSLCPLLGALLPATSSLAQTSFNKVKFYAFINKMESNVFEFTKKVMALYVSCCDDEIIIQDCCKDD